MSRRLNRHSSKDQKAFQKMLNFLLGKCKSKHTVRYHFLPTSMATIKKSDNIRSSLRWRKLGTIACGHVKWCSFLEIIRKLNIELLFLPRNFTLRFIMKKNEHIHPHKNLYSDTVLFTIGKMQKQPKYSLICSISG